MMVVAWDNLRNRERQNLIGKINMWTSYRISPNTPWPQNRQRTRSRISIIGFMVVCMGLVGCLSSKPMVALDSVVYVPHPFDDKGDLSREELVDLYSASPNRNPEGLGVLDSIWLQSRMTLIVWEISRAEEKLKRIAYARSPAEQRLKLQEAELYHQIFVLFRGVLVGWYEDLVDLTIYTPEGVYLIDDRGRKFLPKSVPRTFIDHWRDRSFEPTPSGGLRESVSEVFWGYPNVIFSSEVITRESKAITLFLASPKERMSFTWVFDPDYTPTIGIEWQGSPSSSNRLWPQRQ